MAKSKAKPVAITVRGGNIFTVRDDGEIFRTDEETGETDHVGAIPLEADAAEEEGEGG